MTKEETGLFVHHFDGIMAEYEEEVELDATKAKVEKVREENEKLKLLLSNVLTDYNSLQMHVSTILRQHQQQQDQEASMDLDNINDQDDFGVDISLRLGRSDNNKISKKNKSLNKISNDNIQLDYISRNDKNVKCVTSRKDVNNTRNKDQQEVLLEGHEKQSLKKTRVCVKAPCDDPSINDGCQWRKYGQKTAKTNPLPRAYYRCSMSSKCPVRKQVQRCGEDDTSAYMITYEGNHDHPLPMEATHMAAATSAAASLLQCGSSSSSSSSKSLSSFFPYHHFSLSTTNSHPTITLDLTYQNYNNQSQNYPLSSSSSLSFSFSELPSYTSNIHTLSFDGLRPHAPLLRAYSHMPLLSHETKPSGQQ
ncbi:unnamed protein product [Cochlearia groenlandica]